MSVATKLGNEGFRGVLGESSDLIEIPFRERRTRTFPERIGLTLPWLYDALARGTRALPVGSTVRRHMFRRALADGIAAYNRRDWDAMLLNVAPSIEVMPPKGMVSLGFDPVYRGYEGYLAYQERWFEHWGDFRVLPESAVDLGDRFVTLGRMGGSEVRTGVPVDTEFGTLDHFVGSKTVRQEVFLSHADALGAAGIPLA